MGEPANIPERAAIAIVGGGLAGWAVAEALGPSARDAVLLDAATEPHTALDASLGIARAGSVLSFARLAAGHGPALAAACAAAGRRNRIRVAELAPQRERTGAVVRFAAADEADEMRRSTAMLREWGYTVRDGEADAFVSRPPARFVYAASHAEDRLLDTAALQQALMQRARVAGLRHVAPIHVSALEDDNEVRLITGSGILRAEIVVVATGAALPQLVPFCRFKIVGMRAQWLRVAGSSASAAHPQAWCASAGYELYRWDDDHSVTISGSRRLPIQREWGARTGTSLDVQALLEDNWREIDSNRAAPAAVPVLERGAAVQSVSCDGLPLAGPVPGHPRVLIAGGFGTNTPGLALAAGEVVAQLIRSGRAEHAAPFAPRRFI